MIRILFLIVALAATPALACESVDCWVDKFKRDAAAQGISSPLLDEAFADFEPNSTVIRLDRKQPEGTMSFKEYMRKVMPESRIERAREAYDMNRAAIDAAGARYGVNPETIVALWGVESNFGSNQGSFEVIEALATLAYEGRRAEYFRKELLNAFKIIDAGHISLRDMTGSWAGAMGQCQFMPSSFLRFAADGDSDGRRDIWNSEADVYASIANYLGTVGWDATLPIIVRAHVPKTFDFKAHVGHEWRSFAGWQQLGISAHHPLLRDGTRLKLVRVGKGAGSELMLATRNFDTLMDWNRSTYFVAAVSKLSDELRD